MPELKVQEQFRFSPGDMVMHRQNAYNDASYSRVARYMIIEAQTVTSLAGNTECFYLIRPEGPDTGSFHRIAELEACDEKEYKLIKKMASDE